MNIGLYFGSFNPIHTAHLLIASYVADSALVDKVWFVVSPQNPLKPSNSLLNEYDRLHLVNLAIENDNRFKAVDIEFRLPKPSYTIDTLTYLQEKYPTYTFYVIIGADSYVNLPKWKNYEILKNNYPFIIYNRPGIELKQPLPKNFKILTAPLLEISSTEIRKKIKAKKSILYMLPDAVRIEIERNGYYK
ncbi:MAG TPA: nicotinate (nicotinamide) nucleotide adenylyltransferase [Chitinophagaceae bacterium]|nr:nicotinate-nucleotide adenylyltransferase [Chitinophagaceae bacterium]HMZ46216.1 nicotinate (nicotinamide) nucleotide adenylyltransferase [Chitinophagaceae bacterium]HNF29441.1 nicotinate (nicotinamide) nucleotide adenylyltransferase [Chitinophagaceae bacterium]HNJ58556.1 nicotinate (nicotinamide) nucleotide adenylyltransferase [Chitinophagaceae bacterium]HNL82219.1 nicotinate (nicotinamide) nucleotide adenylyltransferase [Chitinophagaceae bacterium]